MTLTDMKREIDRVLSPLGFVRRNATWNRRSGRFVDVIDLQVSKSRDSVTMNAGVLHSDVHTKTWGSKPPAFVDEPSSTVRTRVGQLVDGRDLWWSAEDFPAGNELASLLATFIVPFVESMHSIEAMERHLTEAQVEEGNYPLPKIHLAILRYE